LTYAATAVAAIDPDVIYGSDNRREVTDPRVNQLLAKHARSTALLTFRNQIADTPDPFVKNLATKSLFESKNLCEDEPFAEQPVGGWCSGFLAGPDILVTAGHCLPSASRCSEIAVVFGFSYDESQESLSSLSAGNVYSCKNVLMHRYNPPRGEDYAIIRLDRVVRGRQPLAVRRFGKVSDQASLAVIGHPSGLPTKIADGGYIRENARPAYFVTNSDSFGGNSGSAVFDTRTGLVEGILVRGERDYEYRGDCMVSYRCDENDCRGEDVTRATSFAAYLP